MRSLRRLSLVVSLALLAACGGGGDPTSSSSAALATAGPASGPPAHALAGGNKVLPVLTRNLYLGADLTPVIAAQTPQEFVAATTAVWAMVQKNDFHVRAEAIADEIAWERPALVGLQEAYLWRIQHPGDAALGGTTPATQVVFDYVQLIVDALRARGLHYAPVAEVTLFDFEAPVASGDDVRMTDRGVILARGDVDASSPTATVYQTLLPLTVLGQQLHVQRGWVSVEVKFRGEGFRFVSTHLESYDGRVRTAQAGELVQALAADAGRVVLVGDLNSLPGTEGEAVLVQAGFADVWAAVHPARPGWSCCFPEDLSQPGTLDQRIDYVLTRGPVGPLEAVLLGARHQVDGLWPSDHAGLAAELRLADGKCVR
ncbi:MAG TPA: endonuclease/exonuclease/phosphatase family protein [Anaeromyxobacter sp.]|nr:endonuclease/exonuclease/phosphatase family protein [Anaeromyxobacter sp.]